MIFVVHEIVVFIQQRCNNHTLGQALKLTSSKITFLGTWTYGMLPLEISETELIFSFTKKLGALDE